MDALAQRCNADANNTSSIDWSALGLLVRRGALNLVEAHFTALANPGSTGGPVRGAAPYHAAEESLDSGAIWARVEVKP